jgi:hypothetical protein
MGDDHYKENFIRCYICGNDVHITDAKLGIDGHVHEECALREYNRELVRKKAIDEDGFDGR